MGAAALRRLWPDVLDEVRKTGKVIRALLDHAQVSSVEGDLVRLDAPSAQLARMIGDDAHTEVLGNALTAVVGGVWRVEVRASGDTQPLPPAGPAPEPQAPPDEPDPRDDTDPVGVSEAQRTDPEAEALSLLQSALGARPLDNQPR